MTASTVTARPTHVRRLPALAPSPPVRPAPQTIVHTVRLHPDEPDLLTAAEVAKRLRVSPMTVYRLTTEAEGGVPQLRYIRVGRGIRIHRRDLDAFLRGAYVDGTQP